MPRPVEPVRCDDRGRGPRGGYNAHEEVQRHLRNARHLLPYLPTDRRQNYEVHEAVDKASRLIDAIEECVCYAPMAEMCIEDTPASPCPRCNTYGLTDDDQTCHKCGYPNLRDDEE